jgi:RNA polymerase sigma-70 factor (ECF subfamily)
MKKISFRADVLPLKDMLFRLALRITLNSAEAEDVVQETMIRVWNRREQWSEIESIEAFTTTICRNLALDRQKRMSNQQLSLNAQEHDTPDFSTRANPEQQTVVNGRISLVKRLMDELPEKQRSCMQLRDIEGKAYKEIAQVLGITEQQVKINIFRARQTIKQEYSKLEKYGL